MIKTYFFKHSEDTMYHDVDLSSLDLLLADQKNLLWIDLYDCSVQELTYIGKVFDFHPLALEDCLQESPRAKVDHYEDYSFFVFHAMKYNEEAEDDEITSIELDVFLGPNYVVTIHPTALYAVGEVARVCLKKPEMMNRGPDYLLYNLVNKLVDDYFPIVERLGERIDELEDEMYVHPAQEITEEVMALKRSIILLRKVVIPQRRILANVNNRYSFSVSDENRPYYYDLVEHLDRIIDASDAYRDLVNGSINTYYSVVSSRTNEILMVLTVISTIMMPLTFITGLYGMNVHIPGQDNPSYFWYLALGCLTLIVTMLATFRRKKWI